MQKLPNRIATNCVFDAVEIYFDTNLYNVDRDELAVRAAASQMAGKNSYFDLDRLEYGKIVCHFNPTTMTPFQAMETAKGLVTYIQSCLCTPEP